MFHDYRILYHLQTLYQLDKFLSLHIIIYSQPNSVLYCDKSLGSQNSISKGFELFEVLEKFGCGWVLGWSVATDPSPGLEYLKMNELKVGKKLHDSQLKLLKSMDKHDQ